MHIRSLILLGTALLIGACQTQKVYEVERTRTYAQDRQAVWDQLLEFLERNQIAVTSADFATGRIEAERRDFEDAGWADCERRRVFEASGGGGSPRQSWALRVDRDLALQLGVAGQGDTTEVTVDASFVEEQINTWSYAHFMQDCRSTGVLERALLDSLGSPAAATPTQGTDAD